MTKTRPLGFTPMHTKDSEVPSPDNPHRRYQHFMRHDAPLQLAGSELERCCRCKALVASFKLSATRNPRIAWAIRQLSWLPPTPGGDQGDISDHLARWRDALLTSWPGSPAILRYGRRKRVTSRPSRSNSTRRQSVAAWNTTRHRFIRDPQQGTSACPQS